MSDTKQLQAIRRKLTSDYFQTVRKLAVEEQRRFDKLTGLLAKLKAGQHVQNRDLQTWLTADEYQSMLDAWEAQKDIRDELAQKPADVLKYEELLRTADFEYSKGNRSLGEYKYEDALLFLQEMLTENPSVQSWFDRDIEWTIDSDLDFDPARVPRTIMSRSSHKRAGAKPLRKLSKNEVKIVAVEQALQALLMGDATDEPVQVSEKLRSLLKLPDDEI